MIPISVENTSCTEKYRIAGNFRGRKLSWIDRKGVFRGENFRGTLKTGHIMGVAYLDVRGENFRGWLKNREIRESFLPRKFPTIRYAALPFDIIIIEHYWSLHVAK